MNRSTSLATVMPELGPPDDPFTSSRRRSARRAAVVVCLMTASLVGGCGGNDESQRKAYEEALAAIGREKVALDNMEVEQKRLQGELLLHEFESRVWMGAFAPHKVLGWDLGREAGNDLRLVRYLYRKWPLGWFGRLDRLLARSAQLLPWYDRQQGDLYGKKLKDRYTKLLSDLRARIAIQKDRVRHAEEYAEIVRPSNAS